MFTNPLSHAGYPPGVTGTPTTQPTEVRAATAAEVAAGVLDNCYVSPATLATGGETGNFTTLTSTGATTLASGAGAAFKAGNATGTVGFYGSTGVTKATSTTDLRVALINLGLYTTGGATPLDLNGGALASGTHTLAEAANIVVGTATGTKIGTATTQKLGWYNATPVVQQTQGAITNSVTAGGSTGTIDNFTDLTVYANDSTAIRNDIYQLSLALQGCIAALRTYGLLG